MRRKVLAMVLSAVMTAGVLAGCGNSSAEKSTADTKGTDSKEATYTAVSYTHPTLPTTQTV